MGVHPVQLALSALWVQQDLQGPQVKQDLKDLLERRVQPAVLGRWDQPDR